METTLEIKTAKIGGKDVTLTPLSSVKLTKGEQTKADKAFVSLQHGDVVTFTGYTAPGSFTPVGKPTQHFTTLEVIVERDNKEPFTLFLSVNSLFKLFYKEAFPLKGSTLVQPNVKQFESLATLQRDIIPNSRYEISTLEGYHVAADFIENPTTKKTEPEMVESKNPTNGVIETRIKTKPATVKVFTPIS